MPLTSITSGNGVLTIIWTFPVPAHSVWAGFDDQKLLSQWLGRPMEWDFRTGGTLVIDHGEGYISRSTVLGADAPHGLAMTWEFPEEADSQITIALHPADAGTTMEFVHSELGGLVDDYGPGWVTHLTYLEAALGGTPLPLPQFWHLHATVEHLYGGAAAEPVSASASRQREPCSGDPAAGAP